MRMPWNWKRMSITWQISSAWMSTLRTVKKFGVLEDIMETGANDVYVVSTEAHTEVLLPAIHDCILDVDTENRKMTVHLMDGLI